MDLRALRSAIHRGDAEAVVNAASGAWDGRLQLVGDALVMAVERCEPGAEKLARRCAEAVRQRGWDGDEELANGLDTAMAGGTEHLTLFGGRCPPHATKPLPVDLELLSDVLEQGLGEDPGRLDITTGEVWPASAIEYALDADTDDIARLAEPGRWLTVEPEGSDEAYRDMVVFVTTVSEPETAAALGRALEGNGAFRRFRNQLGRYPHLEQLWYAFSDERRRGRARAWLAEKGYRPTSPPAS